MTAPEGLVVLGVDWADTDTPVLRTAPAGAETAETTPLVGPWCFEVADAEATYCCGWFDLTGPTTVHVVCEEWAKLDRGKQCRKCQYQEGFLTAHRGGQGALAPNVASYLAQPHQLYIDAFADGTIKVGTVAESRLAARLAEQGAVAARYVARTPDGAAARTLEAAVSTQAGLPQSVHVSRKLAALASPVDAGGINDRLDERVAELRSVLLETAGPGAEIFDTPLPWAPPAVAVAAFNAAPIAAYPGPLTTGTHSLHVRAATGPIAVFATIEDPASVLYAANVAALAGRLIVLGDYSSEIAPTQAALF
jgi:hypothetical protein